jgi:hypothetical protein
MIEIDVKGLKEVEDKLKNMADKAKELEGTRKVSFNELFDKDFMTQYTDHDNFDDFVIQSKLVPDGTTMLTEEIFKAIPDKDFDEYISKTTKFDSWEHMKQVAVEEYYKKQLGL